MKILPLKPGHFGATESGVPKTGDIAVLLTDAYGRSVVHKSGVPAVGEYVYLGTDKNGKPVAIRKGGVPQDPVVDYIWSDATGQFIYFFYYHPRVLPFIHHLPPFGVPELQIISYGSPASAKRNWIIRYMDIRMHQVDEPLPDIIAKGSIELSRYDWQWGNHWLYYEFTKTLAPWYYTPEMWDSEYYWRWMNLNADYSRMILSMMFTNFDHYDLSQGWLKVEGGVGCFGAMTTGKRISAYCNNYTPGSQPVPYMYTNNMVGTEDYPNGQMDINESVLEMLHADPERKSEDNSSWRHDEEVAVERIGPPNNSLVPIQRIGSYADGTERHDRWGTVWCYGLWLNDPAVGYLGTTLRAGSPEGFEYDAGIGWTNVNDYEDITSIGASYVVISPFTMNLSEPCDLDTFPAQGVIRFSTLGNNLGSVKQFGIYEGKTGSGLTNVQIVGEPADTQRNWRLIFPHGYESVSGAFIKKYSRAELIHTIESGPHRITHFTVKRYPGWIYIYNIKCGGAPHQYGTFLYVGKRNGKAYEMAYYYYEKDGAGLKCQSESLSGLKRVPSNFPYFGTIDTPATFLGMEFQSADYNIPTYFYPPFEVEVPPDNNCQGYIYFVDQIELNYAIRFYHDDIFSGVQMNFSEPVILTDEPGLFVYMVYVKSILRVVSTAFSTYILYIHGYTDTIKTRNLYQVTLPYQFYSDTPYDAGRFPKVSGSDVSIPSHFSIVEIGLWNNTCVMYVNDTRQSQTGSPPINPRIIGHGLSGLTYFCEIPAPKIDTTKYYAYRSGQLAKDSASYTAPANNGITFLLIPEVIRIVDRNTNLTVSVESVYTLYRITSPEMRVYRYIFNPGGFIPGGGKGGLEWGFYPVLQMVCYDTTEVEDGDDPESDDPGITHMILRYKHPEYKYYTYDEAYISLPVSCIKQISIPHSSFERIW